MNFSKSAGYVVAPSTCKRPISELSQHWGESFIQWKISLHIREAPMFWWRCSDAETFSAETFFAETILATEAYLRRFFSLNFWVPKKSGFGIFQMRSIFL